MKRSFEDRNRKPVTGKVVTMASFLAKRVERVILARRTERQFSGKLMVGG